MVTRFNLYCKDVLLNNKALSLCKLQYTESFKCSQSRLIIQKFQGADNNSGYHLLKSLSVPGTAVVVPLLIPIASQMLYMLLSSLI